MGVDICYWSDNNFIFNTLDELVYRLERFLLKKICLVYYNTSNETKTYWKFNSRNFIQINVDELKENINSFEFKLFVEGDVNSFENLSQNTLRLIKSKKITITLSFIRFDDLEVIIREKTIHWESWDISFGQRMFSFVNQITDPAQGFSKYDFETLYLMDQILKVFDSSKLLIIGDSCEPLWETINEELYDGNSIDNIIETLDDINLITSEMILSKRVNKLSEWEELEKVVFLFYFKDLSQYFIPCTFEYRFNKNCFQEEKPVEILEVKKTFDGVIGKNKIKSCSVIIEKYLNDRYKCSKFVFDIDNNEISSGDALYYQDKRMKSIIEDALSLDFSSLTSFFKYSKGSGNVYSISYKRADFSFSYSLWINDNREFAPKFFVDFIESIFAAADEEPKHCIKFGEIKLIGVPLIKT